MFELITRTRWDQAQDFLTSGEPPMYIQLLALNGFFALLFIVRRFWASKPIPTNALLGVQVMLLAANVLVMMQSDITHFLNGFI